MTSYVATHSASDLPSIVIDFLVEVGAGFIPFMALVALIAIYLFFRNYTMGNRTF